MKNTAGTQLIIDTLVDKASFKQSLYHKNLEVFQDFKLMVREICEAIKPAVESADERVRVEFKENGQFECQLKFSGDVLIFSYHSNVFNFDDEHFVHRLPYVEEDSKRAYCGMIQIYNFLADSFRYKRFNDVGYMVARIFINHDGHFFVEGKRQLGFLYNDFANMKITKETMCEIIQSAILYTIEFDLLVPPYQEVRDLTVIQKIQQEGHSSIKTGKRLGFRFTADNDRII